MSKRIGVVTAFVHKVDAKQGRVQVEYRGMEDKLRSTWAPIASTMSGGKRGQLFMPEVGDECLVAFHDGQFNHPYVVGFLWNGEHISSEKEAHNRVIVTPGGHQLRFEDKENDTRIILRSKGKHELTLEDKAGTGGGPLVRLKTKDGRELLMDDAQTGGKIQITSGQHKVTLDDKPGVSKIEIAAGQGAVTVLLNVTPPSMSVSVAGNTIDISAGALSITAPGNVSITAGGATSVTVGGTANLTVAGAANITAGGAANITAATTNITSGVVAVNAAVTTFSGVVVATTLVASTVVGSTYTPGVGNLV
jgi:uncharacterized protein involved in type VI secretion and phage assembly